MWTWTPRTISVWRSVRAHGDMKTYRSRRTLRIPQIAVEALQGQLRRQAGERSRAGELWQEHSLVFTTTVGTQYESHNLRRDFRKVTAAGRAGRPLGPDPAQAQPWREVLARRPGIDDVVGASPCSAATGARS